MSNPIIHNAERELKLQRVKSGTAADNSPNERNGADERAKLGSVKLLESQ